MRAAFVLALFLTGCIPPGFANIGIPGIPTPQPSSWPSISSTNPTAYGTVEFQWVNDSAETIWPVTDGEFNCWVTDRPPYPMLPNSTGNVIHLIYNPLSCKNGVIPFASTYHVKNASAMSPVCRFVVRYRKHKYTFHLHLDKYKHRCSMSGTARKIVTVY